MILLACFGAFRHFHDPVPRFGSNVGCKDYSKNKKHWNTIHDMKVIWRKTTLIGAIWHIWMFP